MKAQKREMDDLRSMLYRASVNTGRFHATVQAYMRGLSGLMVDRLTQGHHTKKADTSTMLLDRFNSFFEFNRSASQVGAGAFLNLTFSAERTRASSSDMPMEKSSST